MAVSQQFQGMGLSDDGKIPQPHSYRSHQHMEPSGGEASNFPLSAQGKTYGTVNEAAAWRKPGRVMPFSRQTSGSLFNPFD